MYRRWPEAGWPAIACRRPSASCAAGSATNARDAPCAGCAGTRRASASIRRQRSPLPAWRGVVRTAAPPPEKSGARGLPTRRAPREPWAMTSTPSSARVAHRAPARRTRLENRRRKCGQSNRVLLDSDRRSPFAGATLRLLETGSATSHVGRTAESSGRPSRPITTRDQERWRAAADARAPISH